MSTTGKKKRLRRWPFVYALGHERAGQKEQGVYCWPLKTDKPDRSRLAVKYGTQWYFTTVEGLPMYAVRDAIKVRDLQRLGKLRRNNDRPSSVWDKVNFADAIHALTTGENAPLTFKGVKVNGEKIYTSNNKGIEAELRLPSLLRFFDAHRLGDIGMRTLDAYIAQRVKEECTPNTIRKCLNTLCVIYDCFYRRGMIAPEQHVRRIIQDAKLMPETGKPGQPDSRRALSDVQWAAYRVAAYDVYKTIDTRAITHCIGADTGERPTEILRAERRNLRLSKCHMIVPPNEEDKHVQKSDAFTIDREVWLSDDLVKIITDYIGTTKGGLLIAPEHQINNDQLKKIHWRIWQRAEKLCPAGRYTFKSLRHTRGTHFFTQPPPAGVSIGDYLLTTSSHMGHSVNIMLAKYVHKKKVVDPFGRKIEVDASTTESPCADPAGLLNELDRLEKLGAPAASIKILREWARK